MKPYKNSEMYKMIERMRLNKFQQNMLFGNPHRYDLAKVVKKGVVVYAPLAKKSHSFIAALHNFFMGERADLIGENKILVREQRGIKLYATGFYRAKSKNGHCYYYDSVGNKISHDQFRRIVR